MRAFALEPEAVTPDAVEGLVLCQDVVAVGPAGRRRLGKGTVLTGDDAGVLRSIPEELHLLALDPDDMHEDEASQRLAAAIAGPGLVAKGPVESQTHLRAAYRGLVEVDAETLAAMNGLPDISVYTVYNGQPVLEEEAVAAAKVTPLAVPRGVVEEAERIAAAAAPVVRVWPFLGGGVGVVVREGLSSRNREKFERALQMKIGWFRSPIAGITYLSADEDAIATAIETYVQQGATLVLAAGVNSTDPLDPTIRALERLGAQTERRGVPAHPGSTCWLAYCGDVPVFGLAMCGMFSRTTVLDLLLPRFLAGRPVHAADIAQLGHGGLLGKEMAFRFPAYERDPGA